MCGGLVMCGCEVMVCVMIGRGGEGDVKLCCVVCVCVWGD